MTTSARSATRIPHELKSGDVLRIGEYHVQVQIDSATDFSLDDSALYHTGSTSSRRRKPAPTDLGASLRLENLLEASNDTSSDELKPVNAFGQAVSTRTRALQSGADLTTSRPPRPSSTSTPTPWRAASRDWRARPRRPTARSQQPVAPTAPVAPPVPAPAAPAPDNTPGLQAFCRGAGIGAETLPVDAHARMLHLAGQLLRECLLGPEREQPLPAGPAQPAARELSEGSRRLRRRRSISTASRSSSRNCSRRTTAAASTPCSGCANRSRTRASTTRTMIDAMRAAFVDFVGRLDPRDLAARFERSSRRKTMGNWELYGDFYRSLCDMQPDTLPHIFVETFAQDYDRQPATPKATDNSAAPPSTRPAASVETRPRHSSRGVDSSSEITMKQYLLSRVLSRRRHATRHPTRCKRSCGRARRAEADAGGRRLGVQRRAASPPIPPRFCATRVATS